MSSGTIAGLTVLSGGTEVVAAGVTVSGVVVSSGVTLDVLGTVTGVVVNSGGTEIVSSGGVVSLNSGVTSGLTVLSGGTEIVSSGVTVSGAGVDAGVTLLVEGTASGTVVGSGGVTVVLSGGTDLGATLDSGGVEIVLPGAVVSNTVLSGGSILSSGVIDLGPSGPTVFSGGTVSGGSVASGVTQTVLSGGVTTGSVINSGGTQSVDAGGSASGTVVGSGGTLVYAGGSVSDPILSAGATSVVAQGVTASGLVASSGVTLVISGIASGTTVSSAGTEIISAGGTSVGTVILSGGTELEAPGAVTIGAVISSGGTQTGGIGDASWSIHGAETVAAGGVLSNAGMLIVSNAILTGAGTVTNNGGIVLNLSTMAIGALIGTGTVTIGAGATLEVSGTVASTETLVFNGPSGSVILDTPAAASGLTVTGFDALDELDLRGAPPGSVGVTGNIVTYPGGTIALSGNGTPMVIADGSGGSDIISVVSLIATSVNNAITLGSFYSDILTISPSGSVDDSSGSGISALMPANITNHGSIAGLDGSGLVLDAGGTVVNTPTAIIAGSQDGIFAPAGATTITNAGTISGGIYAVTLAASVANRVIVDPGAVFNGLVDGGSVTESTLELAAGGTTGTLSGLGTNFLNFGTIEIDAGAAWTVNGSNTIVAQTTLVLNNATLADPGTLLNNGTIALDPSSLTVGNLAGTGVVTIAAGSTLEVTGSIATTQTLLFAGPGAELILGAPAEANGVTVTGFGTSDTIDLSGIAPASVGVAGNLLTFPDGTITLTGAATTVIIADGTGGTFLNGPAGPTVVTDAGSTPFAAGDNVASPPVVIDSGVTVTSPNELVSATASITENFQAGEDVLAFTNTDAAAFGAISASYDPTSGVLTLNAPDAGATVAQWQAALAAVTYTDTAITPNTATRAISFSVSDGTNVSAPSTRTVSVADTDQTPVLTTSGLVRNYQPGAPAVVIDSGVTVNDRDNATQTSAVVAIGAGFSSGDTLSFVNTSGATFGNITASYDGAAGVLTLTSAAATATDAQWTSALSAVTYASSSVAEGDRVVSFMVNDGTENSNVATDTVSSVPSATATATAMTVPANGLYAAGQSLDFTVTFSAPVTVDTTGGTPRIGITLNTGGTVYANYLSGSGTGVLTFRYTVVPGVQSLTGIGLGAYIDANGGTIVGSGDSNAALSLSTAENSVSTSGIQVDAIAPTVSGITLSDAPVNNAGSEQFTVAFSKSVIGVTAADFLPIDTGTVTDSGLTVAGSGGAYIVTVHGVTGDGTMRLDLNGLGTGITDLAGNTIASGFNSGPSYTIAHTPPAIVGLDGESTDFTLGGNTPVMLSPAGNASVTDAIISAGGTLTAAIVNVRAADETLGLNTTSGGITLLGTGTVTVLDQGTVIGSYTGGGNGTTGNALAIALASGDTAGQVADLLNALTYFNTNSAAFTQARTVHVTLTDAAGNVSPVTAVTVVPTGSAMGDVHMVTFDGLAYGFQAIGDYTLARSTIATNPFDVQIRTQSYQVNSLTSVVTQVAAQIGGDSVRFDLNGAVSVDGVTDPSLNAAGASRAFADGTLIESTGQTYQILWAGGEMLTITNQGLYFNLTMSLGQADGPGSVQGLMGANSGQATDFQLADGTVLTQPLNESTIMGLFADAWRVGPGQSMLSAQPAPVMTFIAADTAGVTLTGSAGTGQAPMTFTGTTGSLARDILAGFSVGDAIDVRDLNGANALVRQVASGDGWDTTITNGTQALTLHWTGAAAWAGIGVESDQHGGALIRPGG